MPVRVRADVRARVTLLRLHLPRAHRRALAHLVVCRGLLGAVPLWLAAPRARALLLGQRHVRGRADGPSLRALDVRQRPVLDARP
eukprot:3383477-Rhodomonas_salina.3